MNINREEAETIVDLLNREAKRFHNMATNAALIPREKDDTARQKIDEWRNHAGDLEALALRIKCEAVDRRLDDYDAAGNFVGAVQYENGWTP